MSEGAVFACRRTIEATLHAPKAPAEPAVALSHRYNPPNPLGAVSGPLRASRDRYTRMSQKSGCDESWPCLRLARQPGGCATSPREHTTSAHIAVADITCKRRRGRTPGAVTAVTERCRCGLGPRLKDAEHRSVRMNYSQDAAGTTYLSAMNPPWVH